MFKEIIIPGVPIALKRARLYRNKVFDSQSKVKKGIRWLLKSKWKAKAIKEKVHLECTFYFPPSNSWSKKRKEECIGEPHVFTPDIDNVIKFYCDCLNEIVFKDDRQIYSIKARKLYDKNPRTILKLEW